ncbi:tRNA (adenosine(37)-N6)-dimethylallyltransferase MiaA [Alkalitalea saponilacus]|uniref:tRNA dimethylallyltransferase n=1 Tax=Alkalitalea saponilacus TaxID=889453 RepID=A0A1T5CMV8_9BACT|nr:tRNA (adenosine(37)-N6)-dimethylallyltransferase MiaA [Alkalitalea saponilacus]ASB49923.1 tRNA (adenosine(37)-N6)-dimethylallyltransferase MiaA [Alkalitalea saponilacus]SKB60744.1 tRNA dimethylallyltransferase [Alkalitalea saponilacus]
MKNNGYNLIVVLGPTACGKTAFAAKLAKALKGEIISADSRQVYKRMDLGTGKDYDDYIVDGYQVPAHLTDIREPGYKYNVYEYQTDFFRVFEELNNKSVWPILCGGTGLYIEAVLQRYKMIHVPSNPSLRESLKNRSLNELEAILSSFRELHNNTDTDTVKRAIRAIEIETYYQNHPEIVVELPEVRPLIIGLNIDRDERRAKITRRLEQRLKDGMIEEVRGLLDEGIPAEDLIYYGLEYKFVTRYVIGEISYEEMFDQLNIAIHQFAKRQMTWFRGMEKRRGFHINWMDVNDPVESRIEKVIEMLD